MNTDRPKSVLVVEDDTAVRERLLELLEAGGYRATGVGSIAETLAQPNLQDFETILVDWQLPDGTADDLLPKLKSRAPDSASIVVTGSADVNLSLIHI